MFVFVSSIEWIVSCIDRLSHNRADYSFPTHRHMYKWRCDARFEGGIWRTTLAVGGALPKDVCYGGDCIGDEER